MLVKVDLRISLFRATRATDLYTTGTAGLIVGVFLFSAFADFKGRRPAFFICTALMIVFNIIPIWVSHSYTAYVVLKVNLGLYLPSLSRQFFPRFSPLVA